LIVLFVCACAGWQAAPPTTAPDSADAIGSTRNSVVAYPMKPGERAPLTFLAGNIDPDQLQELQKLAPNVKIIAGLNRQSALEYAATANAIDVRVLSPELIGEAPNLVWVAALSAGVDRYMTMKPLVDNPRIVLTNMRAVHGPAIADHAMAMLLQLTRNMEFYSDAQDAGQWTDRDTPWASTALAGKTMLVVGIGGIGGEIAQRAHGFGMRIIATRRSDSPAPQYVERVGKPDDLLKMLPEADVVAICVPLTSETRGMFNEAAFAAMKKGAILINIARGQVIETSAMLAALESGQVGGACLDVTDPEPLPADSPLWKMPNVVITPHTAGDAEITGQRHQALMAENIRRFGAGEPLLNVVDKQAGY
jgi:phosphoglycerate dehydrogenase-like enzyme